jgi:hypothetical protein
MRFLKSADSLPPPLWKLLAAAAERRERALSDEARAAIVQQIIDLDAQLRVSNCDSLDDDHQRLLNELRSLAIPLWSDGIRDD